MPETLWSIRYFRDAAVVEWYRQHGIIKREEAVTGRTTYVKYEDAEREAAHINAMGPSRPVVVIKVSA